MDTPTLGGTNRPAGGTANPDGWEDAGADAAPGAGRDARSAVELDGRPDVQVDGACVAGSTLTCACDDGLLGSRICLTGSVYSECLCGTQGLMRVQSGMIGDWSGTATVPWTSPYQVRFTFDSFTHYSAWASSASFSALYFGPDGDAPDKHYSVDDIEEDGEAVGTIDINLGSGNSVRNRLEAIVLSADLNHLRFYYLYCGQYGPLQYDLHRVVP
jgi:hypothetical protein